MKNPKDVRISKPIERTAAPPLIGSPFCGVRRSLIVTKMMALSDSWRSGPRPRRGLRVKPGAGNAEPKRRGASPG